MNMQPSIEKLVAAPDYRRILELAEKGVPRVAPNSSKVKESIVWRAAERGARGPMPSERMTRQKRTKLARTITKSSGELRSALEQAFAELVPYQFQSMLDALALSSTCAYAQRFPEDKQNELEENDTFHYARFAIYDLLMQGLPDLLETLESAAAQWGEEEQYLAKPNHPNSKRLYFIRRATEIFCIEFGQPMRELTLALTSVYFDCSDLTEADLSRLAPVRNIKHPLFRSAEQTSA